MTEKENIFELGSGVFTLSEMAVILDLPKTKLRYWVTQFWEGKLGSTYNFSYSWKTEGSKAVNFRTFIELYIMTKLSQAGVKPTQVVEAHKFLSEHYKTPYPFANKNAVESLRTEGRKIYFAFKDNLITLDGTSQLNLDVIKDFFLHLDFNDDDLAIRFWPLGKEHSIVIDPNRKFGHPTIAGTNIYPETIANHLTAGDPKEYLAEVYNISYSQIDDALKYCSKAA